MNAAPPEPTLAPEPDAEVVAAAVLACPGVAGLSGGEFGQIATYLPGRRVLGVRVAPGRAEVHVLAAYGPNVVALGEAVRMAVLAAEPACASVDVAIDDLTDDDIAAGDNTAGDITARELTAGDIAAGAAGDAT